VIPLPLFAVMVFGAMLGTVTGLTLAMVWLVRMKLGR
jgi:hypothetical protein